MNTRKILLISSDPDLSQIIKISSLTLTKLNCQISLENASGFNEALEKSNLENLNLIIIDNDAENIDSLNLISEMRKNVSSKNKKIILVYSDAINKDEIFKAGCDSVMSKDEFKKVVNNILVF